MEHAQMLAVFIFKPRGRSQSKNKSNEEVTSELNEAEYDRFLEDWRVGEGKESFHKK